MILSNHMRKHITLFVVGVFVVSSLVGISRARAEGSRGGPFERLWDAIESLQRGIRNLTHRVDTLVLTPGPVGPAGPAGVAGASGAVGPQGPQGDPGSAGAVGPAGADGAVGATGAIGPQGPAGATGATGAIGPTGPAGSGGGLGTVYARTVNVRVAPLSEWGGLNEGLAECDSGDKLLSGGYRVNSAGVDVIESFPAPYFARPAWVAGVVNRNDGEKVITVFAYCTH